MAKLKALGSRIIEMRTRIVTVIVCVALCVSSLITTVSGAETVKIIFNGQEYEVTTHRTEADDIIAQSGIKFNPDKTVIDDSLFEENGIITLESVVNVKIIDGKKTLSVKDHGLVSQVLENAGIKLGEYDEITGLALNDYVSDGSVITVKRAFSVAINADGEITTVYMTGGTVADALNKAVITADDDDIVSKPLDEVLTGNSSIKITRVEFKTRTDTQVIKYSVKTEKTNTLAKGQTKVKVKGVNGEKQLTYEDKYVDGKLVESVLKDTKVTKQATAEVKLVGTKKVAAASSSNVVITAGAAKLAKNVSTISTITPPDSLQLTSGNIPTSYRKKIVGTASAYHCGSVTATGRGVRPGYIAVNPKQIPYHTAMWIVSNDGRYTYGYAYAEDTGGFTKWTGSRATLCDLYMPSEAMCEQFGRRSVTLYIL